LVDPFASSFVDPFIHANDPDFVPPTPDAASPVQDAGTPTHSTSHGCSSSGRPQQGVPVMSIWIIAGVLFLRWIAKKRRSRA
jgi:hypothetical protein